MRAFNVVASHIFGDPLPGLEAVGDLFEIDRLLLEHVPQVFDADVVHPEALSARSRCLYPTKLAHYFGRESGRGMTRKRYSNGDILKLLRENELKLAQGSDVQTACRSVGVSDARYCNWRRLFSGMVRSQLLELRTLEKENARLKKVVA